MQEYIKIVRIRCCNKLFDIFCDHNHKKYFLEVKIEEGDENYYYPGLSDYVRLNLIYHKSDEILYFKKYTFPKISAVVGIAGIGTSLLIGLNIPKIENFINSNYYLQKNNFNFEISDSNLEEEYPNYLKIGNTIYLYSNDALNDFGFSMVSFTELRNTLQNNLEITDKYRDYILKFIHALEERLPETDLRIINYNLKTLKFEIIPNDRWDKEGIAGYYDSNSNQIVVKESYEYPLKEQEVIFHELGHTLNNAHIAYTNSQNSNSYTIIKRFYGENAFGNSFSEGLNTILTDYLLSNNWEDYFNASAHQFSSYNSIAGLQYQMLLLDNTYNLYDYLNSNVNLLQKHLEKMDLLEMIDILDTFLLSGDSTTIEDKNSLIELEEKILEKKVDQELLLNKSDLEIYKSFIGVFLTYHNNFDLCTKILNEKTQDWTIRIREAKEKDKTIVVEENGESKREITFVTLAPEIYIYALDNIVCDTSLDNILVYSTFDDEDGVYHFGRIDYQNDVLYDVMTNQMVDKENLKKMAQLSSILEEFSKYDIDFNVNILNSDYFQQEIEKKASSNEESYDKSNTSLK